MTNFANEREQVTSTCRALLERGYLKATEGNISVRLKGQNAFAITPSNYDYAKMTVDDICVLDFEQKALFGTMKPSIESGMHLAVYQTRPDVHAIIHTHQPYASALALIKMPIPALFDEQVRFLGRSVEIIPYAPSGTGFLKNNVQKQVKNGANAFILQNHGVLVLGGDVERAIHHMALLEKCALAYLLALMTEKKVYKIPLPIREIAFAKLKADEKKFAEL
jgi:L-ribulose-5-phosphate 4-epimerase